MNWLSMHIFVPCLHQWFYSFSPNKTNNNKKEKQRSEGIKESVTQSSKSCNEA